MKHFHCFVVMVLTLAGLAACGRPEPTCGDFQLSGEPESATSSLNIYVDVPSNSQTAAETIAKSLRPYVEDAVDRGAYIHLELDGGDGTSIVTPACFDAVSPYVVSRDNERREMADRLDAVRVLTADIENAVEDTPVSDTGTAQRLLAALGDKSIMSATRDTQSVVWSSLLGTSADGSSCLSVSGLTADQSTVSAVVRRCLDTGQVTEISDDSVALLGYGYGALDAQQSRMASLLAGEICRQVAAGCSVVTGG